MLSSSPQHVVFTLDGQRYALPHADVERVVQATKLTPLPGAPGAVAGLINIRGCIIPVVSLRKLHGRAERGPRPSDKVVIMHKGGRKVAILVDAVLDDAAPGESTKAEPGQILPDDPYASEATSNSLDGTVLPYEAGRLLNCGAYYADASIPNRIGRVKI
ncbi:MAG TPA: chemotaxis protein CheW [Chloroflexia bacterium]|jgi:purine-binding chemotaxis protein CheW